MRAALIAAVAFIGACGSEQEFAGAFEEAFEATSARAIIGGSEDHRDPAVVFLLLEGAGCTGTLISPRVVLTARHCFGNASQARVFFGTDPRDPDFFVDMIHFEKN